MIKGGGSGQNQTVTVKPPETPADRPSKWRRIGPPHW